jgi:hypothetical protein
MIIKKDTSEYFSEKIASSVKRRDKSIDTRIGPFRDIFIDPISEVLEEQNDKLLYLKELMSLSNADKVLPDDLDDLVYNEGVVRYGARSAIATVTFSRSTAPTSDIVIPLNFPISTVSSMENGSSVQFRTTEKKTMYANMASKYYNADSKRYEIDVQVASVPTGGEVSVGAYMITDPSRTMTSFDEVFNKDPSTEGKSVETNRELVARYLLQIKGSKIGTPYGLKSMLLDNLGDVLDAYVVYGDSAYMERGEADVGAVDVWVMGESPIEHDFVTSFKGITVDNVLPFQPLINVVSVSSVTANTTYVNGIDFVLAKGEGIYGYSNKGSDSIRWLKNGNRPNIGDDLKITYTYNGLMNIISSYFKQTDKYFIGSDVLFRWAQPVYVEISGRLKVLAGSPSDALDRVRGIVLDTVNNYKLGQSLETFDISSEVSRFFGVDNFIYSQFSVKGNEGVSDILIRPNQYARLIESDLLISLD